MSLTLLEVPGSQDVWGRHRVRAFDITFDNSYPTGGYAVTGAMFGLRLLMGMDFIGGNAGAGALLCAFRTDTNKIQVFYPTGGGAASPTTIAAPAIASGATTVTSAAANGANDLVPGQGAEVGNTADLHTIQVRAIVISFDD